MAKWHYKIESNKRIKKFNTYNGKTDYFIQDVVKIEENKKIKFEKEYYQNGKESRFVNFFIALSLLFVFIIYIVCTLPDTFELFKISGNLSSIIDNSCNVFGIILSIINSKPILEKINLIMLLGETGNKLYLLLIVFLLSLFFSFVLYICGISTITTYAFGIIGFLLSWWF